MSLLAGMTPPKKERVCHVALKAKELSKEDAAILLAAAKDPAWSIAGLVTALNGRGVNLSRTPIERHRRGNCGC